MAGNSTEMLRKELLEHIGKGDWEQVVEIHRRDQRAFMTIIDGSTGDTALPQAISEGKEDIVEKLVGLITRDKSRVSDAKEILRFENKKQRTSLHYAASTGSTRMCKIITAVDKSLVFARDYKGETPVFRAVRFGRLEVFLYLHTVAFNPIDRTFASRSYCWREDDQTILHNAIIKENFDLAIQIIHLYKELVNLADKEGDSPLHALARKPAAFESGSSLRGRNRIIYDCLFIENFKIKELENSDPEKEQKVERSPSFPQENKQTFTSFVRLLLRNAFLGSHQKKEGKTVDIESRHEHGDKNGSHTSEESRSFSWTSYFVKHASRAIVLILGYGDKSKITNIMEEKRKHVWATQVLNELLDDATLREGEKFLRASERLNEEKSGKFLGEDSQDVDSTVEFDGSKISKQPSGSTSTISETIEKKKSPGNEIKETAILLAAKYGVAEVVEEILKRFPMAIHEKDKDKKNVLLVALEKRHVKIVKFLLNKYDRDHIAFQKTDDNGNTALHYAAMYDKEHVRPWPVPGDAMQMQREIKWYEFVEKKMPPRLYLQTNKEGQTAREKFSLTHKDLVKDGGTWLTNTATACSVVAALIAGVAFASSTSSPGGTVKRNLAYDLFGISSLISLCLSVTSLVMFLAILTSRQQEKDFDKELPRKILLGLSSLFIAIASVLITFCAGHFLIFKDNFKYAVVPVYAVTLLPLCLFAAAQFPLYLDLVLATFWNPFG